MIMRRFNYKSRITWLLIALAATVCGTTLSGCGTIRSYWGVENEYEWCDGHDHHHKPPKHKKHKKHKHHH
jgi:uncharacterized protein YceK